MKAKEIIGEGLGSLLGKGLVKLGSKMAGKGAAAAKAVEPVVDKGPGLASKATGKVIGAVARNPIKSTIAGATAYNLATDPSSDKLSVDALGRALGKTYQQGKKLAGAAWDTATKDDNTGVATSPETPAGSSQAANPSSNKPEKEFDYGDNQPVAAPDPDSDSDGYVQGLEKRIQQRYKSWPEEQNESIKKKFAIAEANKVDLDKELEKHFPDPYVRRAIASRISRESSSQNVGELSYRNTSNKRIREKFPQLRRYSDSQLDALKKDDKQFFDTAYSKIGGYQYRGRGPIQITGRANYEKLDKDLGLNGALVKDPDLLLKDPAISKAATIQYLKNAGLNKTYNTQKDAHQAVIAVVGGAAYAPGTQLGKSELAAVSGTGGDTKIAGTPRGGSAKPSDTTVAAKPAAGPSGEKLIQMPDFSQGFKVGDKFVPQTKQGYGEPVDYKQAYTKAKSDMGISPAEALKQANDELLAKRAAVQRTPARAMTEPTSVVPKTPAKEPEKILPKEPEVQPVNIIPPLSAVSKDPEINKSDDAWDKFINTVTMGRVPPEEKERIRVPESINKEIQDILRLAGKR
jgi:hypothetical protein